MDVIPFNIPGLPEPEALMGEFIVRPVTVDASSVPGPMIGLAATPSPAAPLDDGVLCIYPDTDMLAYLFTIQVRSGQKDLLPGLLVHSVSASGTCTLLSMSYDLSNNPVLTTTILPEEYLPKILTTHDGSTIADVSGIDDRLEFTQVFTANSLGAVQRLSNDLTHRPKESGSAIFDLQRDIDVISDVCSFYLTRALTLSDTSDSANVNAAATAFSPVWRMLWRPPGATAIIGFSFVYALTRTSIIYDRTNGLRIAFNLNANGLQPPPPPEPRQN